MARYKKTEFVDEDISSVSSIQLNEGVSSTSTHIRYHTVSLFFKYLYIQEIILKVDRFVFV